MTTLYQTVQYTVVLGSDTDSIQENVQGYINQGWEVVGGICVIEDIDERYHRTFYQAMIKREELLYEG